MNVAFHVLKFKHALRTNRKLIIFALALFALMLFQTAHAQDLSSVGAVAVNIMLVGLGVIYNVFAWVFGQLIVLTIGMVLIPILGYNNFADSHVINIAWPLVRDVMNMGVILILLYIAIAKMVGVGAGKAGLDQSLPTLFLGVVVMNFSRTICVLIIDASQVVMFTFVNALRDIAAGNFAGLFNVNSLLSVNSDVLIEDLFGSGGAVDDALGAATSTTVMDGFTYLGTSYATVTLLAMVFVVMLIMAVVFIYRIVVLWVLVITSPVAMFLMAVGKFLPGGIASGAGEWRKRFMGAVTLGPILVFFLWLALAAAGTGSIAAAENFPTAATSDTTGFLTEIFSMDEILSLYIGVILLMVGLQVATNAASSFGGVAAQAFGKGGYADRASRSIAQGPARLTYRAGAAGVAGARAAGARGLQELEARTGLVSDFGKEIGRAGQRDLAGGGVISEFANRGVQRVAAGIEGYGKGMTKERFDAANDRLTSMSSKERDVISDRWLGDSASSAHFTIGERANTLADGLDYYSNAGRQKEDKDRLKAQLLADPSNGYSDDEAGKEAEALVQKKLQNFSSFVTDKDNRKLVEQVLGDDKGLKENLDKGHVRNIDYIAAADASKARKLLEDEKVNLSDISPRALKSEELLDMMSGISRGQFREDKDTGEKIAVSLAEQMENGKFGGKLRDAITGVGATFNDPPRVMANAFRNGHLDVADVGMDQIQTNGAVDDAKVTKFAKALAQSGKSLEGVDQLAAPTLTAKFTALQAEAVTKMSEAQTVINDPSAEQKAKETAKKDLATAATERTSYQAARFSSMEAAQAPAASVLGMANGIIPKAEDKLTVREIVSGQPTQVFKFNTQITNSGAGGSDLTKMIEKNVSKATATKMSKQVEQAQLRAAQAPAGSQARSAAESEIRKIRESAEAMAKAIEKNATKNNKVDLSKSQREKVNALKATARYATT